MTKKFWLTFYKTFDDIIALLRRSDVSNNQKLFASSLNISGMKLYSQKRYPEAKAFFRVSEMLGNYDAFQNFLVIHG